MLLCACVVTTGFAQEKSAEVSQEQKAFAAVVMRPTAQQRKLFKQRNKEIRQLVKQYRKASAQEKPAIKERLSQIVSEATDESMAFAKARIAAEKENLAVWEQKLREREENLAEVKAHRVDDLLSGEAQRRFELAKKRWKKEMKDFKKSMK